MGTLHLLEAARLSRSVAAVVVVTSDKCYKSTEGAEPYGEDDILGGLDPYSNSKACAELLVASYRASFLHSQERLRVATARAGNVIGGGDWSEDRLIPDCVRAFSQHRPVALRYPRAVRPWQHVLDPLAGYLMLAERLVGSQGSEFAIPWNFGPDPASEVTVFEVASSIARLWNDKCEVLVKSSDKTLGEAGVLRLNSERARSRLAWRPQWTLERSLRETTGWYRAWQDGRDMNRYSREQIVEFGNKS
jgi:CDP-glucose 4,6-dehydratase